MHFSEENSSFWFNLVSKSLAQASKRIKGSGFGGIFNKSAKAVTPFLNSRLSAEIIKNLYDLVYCLLRMHYLVVDSVLTHPLVLNECKVMRESCS